MIALWTTETSAPPDTSQPERVRDLMAEAFRVAREYPEELARFRAALKQCVERRTTTGARRSG